MTFKEWLTSSYPNPSLNGRWGLLHILTLLLCIAIIVIFAFAFKKNNKAKKIIVWIMVGILLCFEITRRVINFTKTTEFTFFNILHNLLPRPMCAMMCWAIILCPIINKTSFYNFTSFGSILASGAFFAYPGVGFNNQFILFENLYSIVTHSIILITSISLITFKFTNFKFKTMWKSILLYGGCVVWSLLECYVLKIEPDAMYFSSSNDVYKLLGIPYWLYLISYILLTCLYISIFYIIGDNKKNQQSIKLNKTC
ncbi:MAG: YwaF family protein [Clostridia bacterium]